MQDIYTTPFGSVLGTILIGISIYYIWNIGKWPGSPLKKIIYLISVPIFGLFLYTIIITIFISFIPATSQLINLFSAYIRIGFSISFHLIVESKAKKWIAFK